MDSATVAAWIEAGGTVAAVGAATYAGIYAKRAFDKEVERDVDRDDDRRRAQADSIAVWCEESYDYTPGKPGGVSKGQGWVSVHSAKPAPPWPYYLRNTSDVPVYDVEVSFWMASLRLGEDRLPVLPPVNEPIQREVPDDVRAKAGDDEYEGHLISASVRFRDAAGRRWHRKPDGRLAQYATKPEKPEKSLA